MKKYKKYAAAALSLLLAASAAAPAMYSFADEEDTVSVADEALELEAVPYVVEAPDNADEDDIALIDDMEEENNVITSGIYQYTLDDDGNAILQSVHLKENELAIPDSIDGHTVTEITASALLELPIKTVTIPASVTYISADDPFASCVSLEEIIVDEGNTEYVSKDGILYSKDMKKLIHYPAARSGDTFAVPDGIEEIGVAAISESSLKEITLPASVSKINRHCFSFNTALTKVDMSKTKIEEIPEMVFASSELLTDVIFSESTKKIGLAAFYGCHSLENVTLPSELEYIEQAAFQGTGIYKIKIPDTVTYIGYSALGYDENDNINSELTIIGAYNSAAHKYCTDTDSEYDYANDFIFMDNDTYAKELEYEAMNVQTSGEFSYAVMDGEACLTNCSSFSETVEVPEEIDGYKVTSIYYGAFQSCGSTNIILPETVRVIGEDAFSQYVVELTIPGGCKEISGEEPFLRCVALKSITVTEGDGNYSSENGVLYNKDKTLLIAYPSSKEDKDFVLPATVTDIAVSACCYNNNLESVDISSVINIGNYAFEGCTALKAVKLSKELKVVGQNAFLGCSSMKSIRVYDKVETIGDYAFGYDYDDELAQDIQDNPDNYAMSGESVIMPYSVIDGFKMYVDKDSLAYKYADACGIEAVVGTVAVGSKNVDRGFLYVVLGVIAAAVLALIVLVTGKSISKKKKAKKVEERKKKAAEARSKKASEEKSEDEDEEDGENEDN